MKWVLLDVSFVAYRAFYSCRDLQAEDVPTGVLFKFFEQLRNIAYHSRIKSNKFALFADSRRSIRHDSFPTYKANRAKEETPEETAARDALRDMIRLLRTVILPDMGFAVYMQKGLESDDLMAEAARRLTARKRQGVIVTADKDLLQCITDYVHWFSPVQEAYYTPQLFYNKFEMHPALYSVVKAIAGCASDNVPGVPRVGEITAMKYLRGVLPEHNKTYAAIESEDGKKITERNLKLVKLPHPATEPFRLRKPDFRPGVFFQICERYGLQTYLQKTERKAWLKFFASWGD